MFIVGIIAGLYLFATVVCVPLLLRPDRLITTKLLGKIKTFLLYVKVFWTGF